MMDIFNEFYLSNDNIISTVTNNGSNFVKAFKEFGCKVSKSNTESDNEGIYLLKFLIMYIYIIF